MAFLFIPSQAKRNAVAHLYAFCRLVDDIADEASRPLSERHELLECTRQWIREKPELAHPYWDRWRHDILTFKIPDSTLLAIIDGVARDLNDQSFADWSELETYMQGVASAVGEAFLAIVDSLDDRARRYSFHMGRALQYINILRDIESDALEGRNYIPTSFASARPSRDSHELQRIRNELYSRACAHRQACQPRKGVAAALAYAPAEMMADLYFYAAQKYWLHGESRRLSRLQSLGVALCSLRRIF